MRTTNFYKLFAITFISLALFSCSEENNIEEINEELNLGSQLDNDDTDLFEALDKGDLELWKITFPVNASGNLSGNNDAAENKDLEAWLNNNPNDDYFFENGAENKLSFNAPHNGATTSNSSGPRCELREVVLKSSGSGTIDADWDGSNGFHVMQFRMRVREIPSSDRLTFVQIHDTDALLDDVIQLGVKPNSADNNRLWITVQGSIITGPDDNNAQFEPLFRYDVGDWENMKLQCSNNEVKVKRKVGNSYETVFVKNIHDKWPNEDMDSEYFKAGVYLQGEPTSGAGEVQFSKITFKHPSIL